MDGGSLIRTTTMPSTRAIEQNSSNAEKNGMEMLVANDTIEKISFDNSDISEL